MIKTIPAYKPIPANANSPDSSPEKEHGGGKAKKVDKLPKEFQPELCFFCCVGSME